MAMIRWTLPVLALLLAGLAGCGGGGGGDDTRDPLPPLSQDTAPTGERLDYRDRNYFPAAAGDSWTYALFYNGSTTASGTATRTASAGSGGDVVITEAGFGVSESAAYRRTADGIVAIAPLQGTAPPSTAAFVGDLLEYAEPFYAIGATRRIVRQGRWAEDLDGDGVDESFRLEVTQVFVGIETLALPSGSLGDVARFRTVTALTLQPSDREFESISVIGTEEAWWAPGIGLARADRSVVDEDGVRLDTDYSLVLTAGQVDGRTLFAPEPDGVLQKIALVHNALVYDASRQRYYASVPGSVVGNGNRIAVIDAATGAVSYPGSAVGSEPFALALSADGSALYVGLNGNGDVVKLRTSDFTELWRVRLPNLSFYGQLFAENIAVSPEDSDVIAVSMFRVGVSPRHGGVALVRAGVLQPVMTQDHTGSNLITFGADGQYVYGYNNETTEFGLRRLAVLPDGLQEEAVVNTSGGFGGRALAWSPNGLVLGRALYRTPDLALLGQANTGGGGCRPLPAPNRMVCTTSTDGSQTDPRLAVVDAASFVVLATPVYERGYTSVGVAEIVPGPPGQVALRVEADYFQSSATALWLFTSDQLP